MPQYTDEDMRKFEYHEKVKKGPTTIGCLFCPEQIAASSAYVENYSRIKMKKNGCQKAMCRRFGADTCQETYVSGFDGSKIPQPPFCYQEGRSLQ